MELILADTSSNTTCLLPRDFKLGIQNPDTGRFILLKQGLLNLFVLEGTHRIYRLERGNPPFLRRLDNTVFIGDNHESMAFLRKDTVHAYAGAGRWTYRDFITFFLEGEGEWEFLHRSNGLENRWVPHRYDPMQDALYVLGSRSVSHTDWKSSYRDSAYRYHFKNRRWETLGAVKTDLPLYRRPVPREALIVRTAMGDLYLEGESFVLVDLVGNRTSVPKKALGESLSDINMHPGPMVRILLKDTLHIISTGAGLNHHRLRLSLDDFESFRPSAVYMPSSTNRSAIPWMIASAFAAVAGCALWMNRGNMSNRPAGRTANQPSISFAEDPEKESEALGSQTDPSTGIAKGIKHTDTPSRQEVDEIKKHLSPAEWQLVTTLAGYTLDGRSLETDEINKVIGVSQKPPSIQKSRRSLVIGRINRVFNQCTGSKGELVVRERDMEEKRRYNYRLDEEMARKLMDKTNL